MLTEIIHESKLSALLFKASPAKHLETYIEFYRQSRGTTLSEGIRYLPHSAFTIRFNIGDAFQLRSGQGKFEIKDHVLLPRKVTWIDTGSFFAIKFKLPLLPMLMNSRPPAWPNQPVEIRTYLSAEYIEAIEQAEGFGQRVAISDRYFSSVLAMNKSTMKDERIANSLADFYETSAAAHKSVKQIAQSSFVSPKSLQRYFNKNLGISPKTAYCTLRMRRALEAYFAEPGNFHIYDFNYYDHSHFSREIRKFTGMTLSELRTNCPALLRTR